MPVLMVFGSLRYLCNGAGANNSCSTNSVEKEASRDAASNHQKNHFTNFIITYSTLTKFYIQIANTRFKLSYIFNNVIFEPPYNQQWLVFLLFDLVKVELQKRLQKSK